MRERAPVILGTIAIAAVAIGIVIAVAGRSEPPREIASAPEPVEPAAVEDAPSPEAAQDLAARLVRALDGGRPLAIAAEIDPETGEPRAPPPLAVGSPVAPPPPNRPVPAAPPQPRVALGRPLSLDEQVEFAGTFHDWVILRRDEQRRRLAELEANGQGRSGPATAIRRELARLDETEPRALQRYEELAQRARLAREATSPEPEPEPEPEEGTADPDPEDQAP